MTTARIIHGDCIEVMRGMDAESVHAIVTDPPYGHNNNSNGDLISRREGALGRLQMSREEELARRRPILNDGPEANDLLRRALPEFKRILKPGACCCCCGGGGPDPQFARWSLWIDEVLDFKQMIVWDKGPMGMGWHYRRSYETVIVAQKAGAACKWHDESNRVENIIRPQNEYGIRKIIPQADEHPCAKPWQLAAHFIRLHTAPGDTVLDPFAGAGWVGEACVMEGRSYIGIELDPHWAAIAEKRLAHAAKQRRMF